MKYLSLSPSAGIAALALWILLPLCAVAVIAAAADADNGVQDYSRERALVDSLYQAGRHDSVVAVTTPIVERIMSTDDIIPVADLMLKRGRSALALRMYDISTPSFLMAAELGEATGDTASWSEALGYAASGITYRGDYEGSLRMNLKKLELSRATGDREGEAWARAGMANAYLYTGKYETSRDEYLAAIGIFRDLGLKEDELTPLVGLGRAYSALNEIDSAKETFKSAWIKARDAGAVVPEINAANNLGSLEYRFGDMATAARYFEHAYQLSRKNNELRGAITPATNIALVRNYLRQHTRAAAILTEALEICNEAGIEDLKPQIYVELGNTRAMQGRNNEAVRLYRSTLAMGPILNRWQRDAATYGLARALYDLDSLEVAVEVLEDGVEKAPVPVLAGLMRILLARCLRLTGRSGEALDTVKSVVERDDWRAGLEETVLGTFEMSACYREAGMPDKAYEWFGNGVDALDRYRSSTTRYNWREAHGRIRLVADCGRILLEYPPEVPEQERISSYFGVLQKFKARTLADRISDKTGRNKDVPAEDEAATVSIRDLQASVLREGELLLDYTMGNEFVCCFAITADSCSVVEMPWTRYSMKEKVELYLEALKNPDAVSSGVDVYEMSRGMYDLLLGPVDGLVCSSKMVLISPDWYLGAVPFGLLEMPVSGGGKTLMERMDVDLIPSATVLSMIRADEAVRPGRDEGAKMLALAPEGDGLKGVKREISALRDNFAGVRVHRGMQPVELIGGGEERVDIIHIAAHVIADDERPWDSGILLGESGDGAAGTRGLSADSSDAFMTRYLEDPSDADSAGAADDPFLRADKIASAEFGAKLAVLSGCESAMGRTSSGEGVLGLTAAFMSAGVPAVVATLWPVDDRVTADLIERFYSGLAEGNTVIAALRSAQLAMRDDEKTRHPFYWAGFIVVGDGTATVPLEYSDSRRGFYLPVAIVAAALGVLLLTWKRIRMR
jgi:CHAT domain-containing protein/tetratricopeptide (TPR) repeat protein